MIFVSFLAATVTWLYRPNPECSCGYQGWRLKEEQIVDLDARLELPKGAGPREQYVRYYAGHITPGRNRQWVLLVSLIRKGHPPLPTDKTSDIYISYARLGPAYVPTGDNKNCTTITGSFDRDFRPIEPLSCTRKQPRNKDCDTP